MLTMFGHVHCRISCKAHEPRGLGQTDRGGHQGCYKRYSCVSFGLYGDNTPTALPLLGLSHGIAVPLTEHVLTPSPPPVFRLVRIQQ
jgi:hypothetical protein